MTAADAGIGSAGQGMDIGDRLEMLRGAFPLCNALVLTDVTTGMSLCARTRTRIQQEQIDQLSDTATLLLGDATAALTSAPVRMAIVIDGDMAELFLRSADPGTEALCCNLSAAADLAPFAKRGWQLLAEIGRDP